MQCVSYNLKESYYVIILLNLCMTQISEMSFTCVLTHITRIRGDFDVANSLQYHAGFAPMLFQWSHSHMQHFCHEFTAIFLQHDFFHSRPLFIV